MGINRVPSQASYKNITTSILFKRKIRNHIALNLKFGILGNLKEHTDDSRKIRTSYTVASD